MLQVGVKVGTQVCSVKLLTLKYSAQRPCGKSAATIWWDGGQSLFITNAFCCCRPVWKHPSCMHVGSPIKSFESKIVGSFSQPGATHQAGYWA